MKNQLRFQSSTDSNFPDINIAVQTLLSGGFILEDAQRKPGYMLLFVYRYDEFGAAHKYSFLLPESQLREPQVDAAKIASQHHKAQLILVSDIESDIPAVDWTKFLSLFGGPVYSVSALDPDFSDQLIKLGHNKLPSGLIGRPDELFEGYVRIALEFMFAGRVIRYGQDRRFEARPDGIALPRLDFTALYDAKAYEKGYTVTIDSVRQFGSYVRDFQRRYRDFINQLNSFIVISGSFPHKQQTLEKRSRDLQAEYGVPLAFLTAEALGGIISLLTLHPTVRRSIFWPRIFADTIVKPSQVEAEIGAIIQDKIIPKP